MKISEILAQTPISSSKDLQYLVDWGHVFRFDKDLSQDYGWWPTEQVQAAIKALDLELRTYWADRSQGRELNAIFLDGAPFVLYETDDSWNARGETWFIDAEAAMLVYDKLKPEFEITIHDIDEDIDSSYIGIVTPPNAYYS